MESFEIISTIIFQLKNIIFGLVNKAKDHIERDHQDGVIISKMYADVTDFSQSQTLQVQLHELLSNPDVKN